MSILQVRKKPVEVQAMLFEWATTDAAADWCGGRVVWNDHLPRIDIVTLEGTMRADPGDYIIRGVKGEFYPCKPEIFLATYDRLEG